MIETARLTLRPHVIEDFPAMAAMWGDPEFVRFISGKPQTREEVWQRLQRYAGHWALKGFGFWAIVERDGGSFVGDLGFMEFEREMQPGFGGAPEMGWGLSPAVHGKGYALEAGAAALAWMKEKLGPVRTVCMIAPTNTPSLRLSEKLGFSQYAEATYKGSPSLLFERTL